MFDGENHNKNNVNKIEQNLYRRHKLFWQDISTHNIICSTTYIQYSNANDLATGA